MPWGAETNEVIAIAVLELWLKRVSVMSAEVEGDVEEFGGGEPTGEDWIQELTSRRMHPRDSRIVSKH